MLSQIHNTYDILTNAEKKIAKVILAAPEEAATLSVKQLAQRAETAPSAVIRFCKSVGVDGFSQLKLLLAAESARLTPEDEILHVSKGDSASAVFGRVFHSGIYALKDTLSMMNFEDIETISQLFSNSERVVFFGVGTSSVIAIDAHYRFAQLGIPSASCTDILFMNVTAVNLKQGDVAVGISHSGSTKATVDALRRAKKAGAATVAITSFAHSLLAKECDYSVIAFSDEQNYPVEAVSARVAHICIVDAFMMMLATLHHETLPKHLLARNQILKDIRYEKGENAR